MFNRTVVFELRDIDFTCDKMAGLPTEMTDSGKGSLVEFLQIGTEVFNIG
jgi:hypothetical protein